MDREKLISLKAILDGLTDGPEPSEKELDYDEDAITMYHDLYRLRESMERMGF